MASKPKKAAHLSKPLSQLDLANSGNEHSYSSDDKLLGGRPIADDKYARTPSQSGVLSQELLGRGEA